MNVRWVILPLAVAAFVALIAGCGGGGGDGGGEKPSGGDSAAGSTIASSSLSKEEFVEQATKACGEAAEAAPELAATYLQQHEPPHPTPAESRKAYEGLVKAVIVPTIEKQVVAVRRLGIPEGDGGEVEAFLDSEENEVGEVAKLTPIVSRFQYERYLAGSAKLMIEYGLEACANGSS